MLYLAAVVHRRNEETVARPLGKARGKENKKRGEAD
jgi:hypothetical protein